MAYTNQATIEDFLDRSLNSNEVDSLVVLLPAIEKWIDRKLGSHFDNVSETSRKYDGGVKNLDIDPCTAITAVKHIDSEGNVVTTYDSDDYIAEPANETVKRELRARFNSWPRGTGLEIQVTAKFSEYDGAVPDDIKLLATRLAGQVISTSGEGSGIKRESLEGHTIEYAVDSIANKDSIIMSILATRNEPLVG